MVTIIIPFPEGARLLKGLFKENENDSWLTKKGH
jgi:hypothetical protein